MTSIKHHEHTPFDEAARQGGSVATLVPIMAAVFTAFIIIGLAMPVLPLHVHQGLGLGTFLVGLVAGSQFAAAILSRAWAGRHADASGPKHAVAFGLGFLHAQERFFQMDLCRRAAAGELSELFGRSCLAIDRNARVHQFRRRAERIVASIKGDQRELLLSYSAGVLTGMRALRGQPFEYMLLRFQPVEWRREDTLLVVFYMYQVLQDNRADQDYNLRLLYDALPASVADFLTPVGSPDWDAPLVGEPSLPAGQVTLLRCHHQQPVR